MFDHRKAIIPPDRRISACAAAPGNGGGVVLKVATVADYVREGDLVDLNNATKLTPQMQRRVELRGMAILYEIYDTIYLNIPFKCSWLVHELRTVADLSPKSRYDYINAALVWASVQEEPQVARMATGYILTIQE